MNPTKPNPFPRLFNIPYRLLFITLLIGLQALTLAGILLATRRTTEATLRTHAQEVMEHVVTTVTDKTLLYLAPAEKSAVVTASLLTSETLDANDERALEAYFLAQLESNEQIQGMFLGKADGDFTFVSRTKEGFRSKFIRFEDDAREVELIVYKPDKTVADRYLDPEDSYDPRTRPWYRAASQGKGVIWTDPYIFFSAQTPGITAAIKTNDGVVGVDIELDALSDFVASIPIGEQGSALIQTADGLAVAYPSNESMKRSLQTLPKATDTVGPVLKSLSQTIDKSPSLAPEFTEVNLQENHFAMVSPFNIGENTWYVLVQAPSKDFTGTIQARYRRSLIEILSIGLVTCFLAAPLGLSLFRPLSQLHHRATTDELTGLLNRNEFVAQASRCLKENNTKGISSVLAIFDLDGFKPINDTYGHLVGDEVLATVGNRLIEATRDEDIVSRMGGDEFAIFLPDIKLASAAETVERIRQRVGTLVVTASAGQQSIGATAGFAHSKGESSLIQLIAQADNALISGKLTAKNQTYGSLPMELTEPKRNG